MLSWDQLVYSLANNPSIQAGMSESRVSLLQYAVFDQTIIDRSPLSNAIINFHHKFLTVVWIKFPQITNNSARTLTNWLAFQVCRSPYKSAFQHYSMMRLQHILFLDVELHVLTRAESMRDKNATRISYYSHSLLNHPFARD